MVRIENEVPEERFDDRVLAILKAHGLHADVTGWTRMTIDAYSEEDAKTLERTLLARVESIAMTTGEVLFFHEDGLAVAKAVAEMLEEHYVDEAVICKREAP